MKELQKMRSKKLLVILPFVLALVLLANVNSVKAQNIDYITLFQGQSATVSASQSTPIGSHFVWVTTIGNMSLGAGITGISPGATGFWSVVIIGTGAQPVDVGVGIVPWSSGQRAQVSLQRKYAVNFGLVISSLYLTAADDNVGYNISIGQ